MEHKPLGMSGVKVPEVGFGTWRLRSGPDVIHHAIDQGAWLIDTAETYGTEDLVGRAIRGRRDECFIATKVAGSHLAYQDVLKAADGSLSRLGIEVIDLYQVHWPNARVPIEETMRAMDELVRAGKVRFIGVSNFSLNEMLEADRTLGPGRIVSNQIKYSLFDRDEADELLPYCVENGVTLIAYSSLEQGAFRRETGRRPELVETLDRIRAETGKTEAQILLNWVLYYPNVVAIPKTDRIERVDENCGASGWHLNDDQYAALSRAAGGGGTPYWWREE